MRSIICEPMPSDRVAMVNQHALRATTQFSLKMTSSKILKSSRPDVEHFATFLDGLHTQLFTKFSLSTMMLCNFDFLVLRPEDSGSYILGTRRKSCWVPLAWGYLIEAVSETKRMHPQRTLP